MTTAARACPSCAATLPADAIFCHKCGTATPIDDDRGVESASPDPADPAEAAQRAAVQNALGETYEVRRLLGRGGFAEVYVAYDKRLKREIAVKTIRGDLVVNETLLERFQREAEAVAKLRHPNVIPIYSVGESGGLAFFTMPLIEGDSLASVVQREGRLSVTESVRILREASNALHAAHRVGLVHRDVKPENIMLEGPERSVVVMDFGIAKSGASESAGLTGTGMLVGTPDYMSPEQAMGERTLDARSDQYSLAMVGYRMLTGRVPFEGDSVQTLIYKTVTQVPPGAHELTPDVPIAISDVVSKALAKRPEDRYESMAAFAGALTQVEQASHAAGTAQRDRRRVDLATRVREMHAAAPKFRTAIAVAVAGVIATVALLVAATPRAPFAVASIRDDALFAAKTLLKSHTGPGQRSEFTTFVSEDSVYRFLRPVLGWDSTNQRASTDVALWRWSVRSLSPEDRSEWRVWLGPAARVIRFAQTIADSAPGARISIDSARTLATRELIAQGWDSTRLRPLEDSTIARKARSEYLFRWAQRTGAIPWRGTDSAFMRVSVGVSGDRVTRFNQSLRLPDGFRDRTLSGMVGTLVLLFFFGVVASFVAIVRRQQADELQWGTMGRLLGAGIALLLLQFILQLRETIIAARSGAGSPFSQVLTGAIGILFVGAGALCIAVAGESLAHRRQPSVGAGLTDVSRGRFIVPEFVTAAVYGYALAGILAALGAGLIFLSMRTGIGTPMLPPFPFGDLPFVDIPLSSLVGGGILALIALLLYGLAQSIRQLSRVAVFIPAALTAAVLLVYGPSRTMTVDTTITILVLTYAIARFGLLTAILTGALTLQIHRIVPLLRAGDSRDTVNGMLTLVIFLVPAAVAFVAYRKYAAPGAVKASSTSGVHSGGAATPV